MAKIPLSQLGLTKQTAEILRELRGKEDHTTKLPNYSEFHAQEFINLLKWWKEKNFAPTEVSAELLHLKPESLKNLLYNSRQYILDNHDETTEWWDIAKRVKFSKTLAGYKLVLATGQPKVNSLVAAAILVDQTTSDKLRSDFTTWIQTAQEQDVFLREEVILSPEDVKWFVARQQELVAHCVFTIRPDRIKAIRVSPEIIAQLKKQAVEETIDDSPTTTEPSI